jgi:transcriptional regulator with GAF, ATPase, and Fis domain/Tfp pilus assembly protein PilF
MPSEAADGPLLARRYRLGELLGRGSSADVYRGHDIWTGESDLAIKMLRQDAAALLPHMLREFCFLYRFGHPHLAGVVELSYNQAATSAGDTALPFLVQKRYRGKDAMEWAREHEHAPEKIAIVALQISAALATLHAQGIAHGDIKPANIVVEDKADGPFATLIDFGLAFYHQGSHAAGTPRFMAPEALLGRPVLKSDLYSLGATLAMLSTGKAPQGQPGAPQSSPHFTSLIEALTHGNARQRLSCVELFESLAKDLVAQGNTLSEPLKSQSSATQVALGQSSGDQNLLKALQNPAKGCKMIRVVGRPGTGRTRAARECHLFALAQGMWSPMGVQAGRLGTLQPLEHLLRRVGVEVAQEALPAEANGQDYEAWRFARFELLAQRLKDVSTTNRPIAIIVDDVPIDSPLDRLGRYLGAKGDSGPEMLWCQTGVEGEGIKLASLNIEDVRHTLACRRPLRPLDQRGADELHRISAGHPKTLHHLLTTFAGDELLAGLQQGSIQPQKRRSDTIKENFASLNEASRRLVSILSLFRDGIALDLLQKLCSPHTPTIEELQTLETQGWAQASAGDGELVYALVDFTLGEIWQEELAEVELRRVAEVLDSDPRWRQQWARELGFLWHHLGEVHKSRPHLLAAANHAFDAFHWTRALAFYELLLKHDPGNPSYHFALGKVQIALGQNGAGIHAFRQAGDYAGAAAGLAECLRVQGHYEKAIETLQGSGPPAKVQDSLQVKLARLYLLAGHYDQAQTLIQKMLQRDLSTEHHSQILNTQGLVHYYQAELDKAQGLLAKAVSLAEESGDLATLGGALSNWALVLQKQGHLEKADEAYAQSIRIAKEQRHLPSQLSRLLNQSTLRQDQRRFDLALEGYREAEHLARLLEATQALVTTMGQHANVLVRLGDLEGGKALAEQALELTDQTSMRTQRAWLMLLMAEISIHQKDLDRAQQELTHAKTGFGDEKQHLDRGECAEIDLLLSLRRGQSKDALAKAEKLIGTAEKADLRSREIRATVWLGLASMGMELSSHERRPIHQKIQRGLELALQHPAPDELWLLYGLHAAFEEKEERQHEATVAAARGRQFLSQARSSLGARFVRLYGALWYREKIMHILQKQIPDGSETPTRTFDRLLAINRELTQDRDPQRLLERIIDAAIALSGAERGLIVWVTDPACPTSDLKEEMLDVRTARNMDRESMAGGDSGGFSRSIALSAIQAGAPITSLDAQGDRRFDAFQSVHLLNLHSVLCLPLSVQGRPLGALYLDHRHRTHAFSENDVVILSAFGDQAAIALANADWMDKLQRQSEALELTRNEVEELNRRLETELAHRTHELSLVRGHQAPEGQSVGRHGMIGQSPPMLRVYKMIDRVADRQVPVYILGASGTGKELVAQALHQGSSWGDGPFVSVNCGAISPALLESELFGHEKGAFTGAVRSKAGLFEVARGGTIFLDEIADMPPEMQVKLLRVLQQKEYRKVGGTRFLTTDARVVSASNQDLEQLVREGRFREDLWYRLNVVELKLCPLVERRDDIYLLVQHFMTRYGGAKCPPLTPAAQGAFLDYHWPGNIRELQNEVQRALALADEVIDLDNLSPKLHPDSFTQAPISTDIGWHEGQSLKQTVDDFERRVILKSLESHAGKVSAAARTLEITRAGLYKKINKHGIRIEK